MSPEQKKAEIARLRSIIDAQLNFTLAIPLSKKEKAIIPIVWEVPMLMGEDGTCLIH